MGEWLNDVIKVKQHKMHKKILQTIKTRGAKSILQFTLEVADSLSGDAVTRWSILWTRKTNSKIGDIKDWTHCPQQHSTMVSILAYRPSCPEFDSQQSQFFSEEKSVGVAEVNQHRCLEESGQRLEYADWTRLVLANGKLVLPGKR